VRVINPCLGWNSAWQSRFHLISVQPPRSTRSSSLVSLTWPPTSSSLRHRSFRYASPCLWNQLPRSLHQPHFSPSVSDLLVHAPTTSSHSVNSPLSPSVTPSLSPRAQDLRLSQIFPTIDSLPALGLTPWTLYWTVFSEHLGFCYYFLRYSLCSVPWGRLSWLFVSFWAHVNISVQCVQFSSVYCVNRGWQNAAVQRDKIICIN